MFLLWQGLRHTYEIPHHANNDHLDHSLQTKINIWGVLQLSTVHYYSFTKT
jgi:hypothetical protein